jgi:hypothetical protein
MPVLATEHTPAGAKAFAVFFIKTIDWAYATTSTTYMRHYAMATCVTCTSLITGINKARKAHHQYIGGRTTILRARPGKQGALVSQIVTVNITSVEEVDSAMHYVQADVAHNGLRFEVRLSWGVNGWAVREVLVVE